MTLKLKHDMPLPFWGFLVLLALGGLGWMIASYLLGEYSDRGVGVIFGTVGFEIAKALFIGSTAGILVTSLVLKQAKADRDFALRPAGPYQRTIAG